jgi:hypothetical protein
VTGRGNLVALTLGSEVALLNFANPDSPVVLSEIQLNFIPRQTALHDSFLLTCGNGIGIWNIADSTHPVYRNVIPYGVGDFSIVDTFLYFVSLDTFWAYSIGNPASPRPLGFCRDSGSVTTATQSTAVLRQPGDVLGFVDVSNPAAPRQVGTYPSYALAADARGNICCAAIYWSTDDDHFRFEVLDISDPANVRRIGAIDSVGGWDVHLSGSFAFAFSFKASESGFAIVDVQDSTHPHVVSSCATPGNNYGVWADWTSDWAYVADAFQGLTVLDISNLGSPRLDTFMLGADYAEDITVDGQWAYVADLQAGLHILSVLDPTQPVEVGVYDTIGFRPMYATAAARDSYAYVDSRSGGRRFFRSVDVTDKANPRFAADCELFNPPEDIVLRDSFAYCAEAYRFQVVNVARPRQPTLVGSCVTADVTSAGLCLRDTIAIIAYWPTEVINVADPTHPVKIGDFQRGAYGVDMRDTLAFLASGGLQVYSIANPAAPYSVDSISFGANTYDVVVVDTLAYAASRDGVRLLNVSDVHDMRVLAFSPTPDFAWRLAYAAPYVYAACYSAGVCIFDTVTTGVGEARSAPLLVNDVPLVSSPVRDQVTVKVRNPERKEVMCNAYTVAGTSVPVLVSVSVGNGWTSLRLDLRSVSAGVYLLRVSVGKTVYPLRITKL